MPGKRAQATSSNDSNAPGAKRPARSRALQDKSDGSSSDESDIANDSIAPTSTPPLEATNPQLPKSEGAAMDLQAVHLIKGLNASKIALLRANRQQF